MATASQDRYVRVWSFEDLHVDLSRLDVYAPKPQLRLGGRGAGRQKTVAVVCEALLAGHEDWVHGVRWMVAGDGDQQLTLLSSSMDRTMILWQQVSDDGGSVGTYLGVCMYGVEEGLIPGARYGGNEYIDDQCEQGAAGGPPPPAACGFNSQSIVRSIPWFVSITGCQKRCDSNERATLGCRRTWLSASCLRAISRPPHITHSLLTITLQTRCSRTEPRCGRASRWWATPASTTWATIHVRGGPAGGPSRPTVCHGVDGWTVGVDGWGGRGAQRPVHSTGTPGPC